MENSKSHTEKKGTVNCEKNHRPRIVPKKRFRTRKLSSARKKFAEFRSADFPEKKLNKEGGK